MKPLTLNQVFSKKPVFDSIEREIIFKARTQPINLKRFCFDTTIRETYKILLDILG